MESDWIRVVRERQLRLALAQGWRLPRQQETVQALERRWAREGLTLATRYSYVRQARLLGRFLGKPFEETTREDLEAYMDDATSRLSANTAAAIKRFLKTFYKALLGHDGPGHPEVVSWIRLRAPRFTAKLPTDMLSTADVKALAEATTHPRDKALVLVLYESAARISELASLRVGDVEMDEYGARVMLRGKTGMRRVRLIDSVPDLQMWLNHHPKRRNPEEPLWISWGHQNLYEPLMENGMRKVLQAAAKLAGIRKRVHPHLFRHSRLTELAKTLSESELKVFAGWTADSSMAKVYIHLSGDDVDRKILEKAGLLRGDKEKKASPLQQRVCPRCREKNSAASAYCTKCTMPLEEGKAREWEQELDLLRRRLPKLLQMLQVAPAPATQEE